MVLALPENHRLNALAIMVRLKNPFGGRGRAGGTETSDSHPYARGRRIRPNPILDSIRPGWS
jgi:hypothetical protein